MLGQNNNNYYLREFTSLHFLSSENQSGEVSIIRTHTKLTYYGRNFSEQYELQP